MTTFKLCERTMIREEILKILVMKLKTMEPSNLRKDVILECKKLLEVDITLGRYSELKLGISRQVPCFNF
jgi:hypothetical protein